MISIARVGEPVQFYSSGEAGKDPTAAVVTSCNEEGVANLVVFPMFGGTMTGKLGIRHAADPWHKEHPEASRGSGCWDFIPEDKAALSKELPEPKGRK